MTQTLKKYKLIKEYPGSPKLGTIEEIQDIFKDCKLGSHGKYLYDVNRYPEFWQEVVEKDYEILSYQSKDKIIAPATNFAIEISKPGHWNIHSVKRLSDGEIFTIGDKIVEQNELSKIEYFEIRGEDLFLRINHQITKGSSTILIISNFKKYKQSLFISEDGINIYDGDRIWCVSNELDDLHDLYTLYEGKAATFPENSINMAIYFSTKEAAEEYILMNKPCLSVNDVIKNFVWFKDSANESVDLTIKSLKELVK